MTKATRDDLELLRACSNGDERALASLYDRHGKVAYGVALRVLRDGALAEEAVHDTFLTVWRYAASYDPARGRVSTWIIALAHRRAVDLRRERRLDASPVELEATTPRTPVDSVDEDVVARIEVQAALWKLSSAEREILALAYWDGLTQSQIAARLRVPLATARSWTLDAVVRLRDVLRQTSDFGAALTPTREASCALAHTVPCSPESLPRAARP
jgi:RNA polymerase sigma-70 factor (ECF subfamily)